MLKTVTPRRTTSHMTPGVSRVMFRSRYEAEIQDTVLCDNSVTIGCTGRVGAPTNRSRWLCLRCVEHGNR